MDQPVKILLIEDSPLFVELTKKMLAAAKTTNFELDCVDTLAAGIARLSQGGIDAVLLDLTLPDGNGLDTFLQLQAANADVPTVIYTSLDDEALSLAALDQGAADYLVKSEVNANWLARSLAYAIQRSQPVPSAKGAPTSEEDSEKVIRTQRSGEAGWLAIIGEKKLVSVVVLEQLKNSILSLLRRADCEEISVDMSRVDYIANAAISMLLIVHKRTEAAGKHLVLCGLKPQVHEQFSSRRFDKLFDLRRA